MMDEVMNNGVSYTSTKPLEEFEINKKNKTSDLISRLSELRSQYNCFDETERDAYHTLSEAIEALKEQKTGKWQKYEGRFDYNWECSECGCSAWERTDYCAHCGARMESKE